MTERLCKPGGKGWFLPISDAEHQWRSEVRGLIYACMLIYVFLGISIVSDIFMSSIEEITRRKVKRRLPSGDQVTKKVWNDTVATLSLMALGSSAPEIFLAVLELLKKNMHTGDLGPSTITGSAAFNLFVIVAVCISAIPAGETRSIKEFPTFIVTAIFSVFAYLWLVIILVLHTEDVVDVSEGVGTLLLLPVLIWVSYSIDVGFLGRLVSKFYDVAGTSEDEAALKDAAAAHLFFVEEFVQVHGSFDPQYIHIAVKRKGGTPSQTLTCSYRTEKLNAVPGFDYVEAEGTLTFQDGVDEQWIWLEIKPRSSSSPISLGKPRDFLVILESLDDVKFDNIDSDDCCANLTVTIGTKPSGDGLTFGTAIMQHVCMFLDDIISFDRLRFGGAIWADQFTRATYCGGSLEEHNEASVSDWVMHLIALPWKLIFACVPPPAFYNGWLCFIVAIASIGLLTCFVSDLAELFGCVLDVPDIVTAITFVALGTSMPDLFASLIAASEEPTADASVVNVTGSNSVNVFLGLGLPWTCASIHWRLTGRTDDWVDRYPDVAAQIDGAAFVVASDNLGFSVVVFSGCSSIAIFLLLLRRRTLGCELGGPTVPKLATSTAFIGLWVGFVVLTSWRVLRCSKGSSGDESCEASEQVAVIGGVILALVLLSLWPVTAMLRHREPAVVAEKVDARTVSQESAVQVATPMTIPPPLSIPSHALVEEQDHEGTEMSAQWNALDWTHPIEDKPHLEPIRIATEMARNVAHMKGAPMIFGTGEHNANELLHT